MTASLGKRYCTSEQRSSVTRRSIRITWQIVPASTTPVKLERLGNRQPASQRLACLHRDLRRAADAIFYRMRTGYQWKVIPPSLCPGSTAFGYFKQRVDKGVFPKIWKLTLEEYDELVGLDWRWQSVDGAMTKAPLGGESTGKNPTDREKGC